MLRPIAPGLLLLFTPLGFAQTSQSAQAPQTAQTEAAPTEFEVATIKPYVPPAPQAGRKGIAMGKRGGPGTNDPGQVSWNGVTLKNLLMTAYNVKNYQVTGPLFLDTERFNVLAKVPSGATKEQVLIMLQNLLAERFKVKLHRETKEIPIYELVVAKNGPKLKESAPDPEPPKDQAPRPADGPPLPPMRPEMGPDGCPIFPPGSRGGTSMMMMPGRFRLCASKMTLENLANTLGLQLDRPLFDKTGLKGRYDFRLEFAPEGQMGMMGPPGMAGSAAQAGPPPEGGGVSSGPNSEPAPPIAAAFQSQLGLKLEAKKAPAEMLIVDSVEKTPTEN
jgi:uncharacterized protein (TIGR03435 family)